MDELDKMARELLPCPFCGADMELVSNRDWHRVLGHADGCIIECEDAMTPATDEQRALLVADWNRRPALLTAPPGYVLVPESIDPVAAMDVLANGLGRADEDADLHQVFGWLLLFWKEYRQKLAAAPEVK